MLFTAVCGACHVMYGQGGKIGPDLTGSGRANLDYLLENIAAPSGVVSAVFRMSLLTLKDGRNLIGVIAEKNDHTVTLRTVAETLTLDRSEITKTESSPMSMMPEGLLLALQPDMVRDLIAYLMHPVQVPLPANK
jgi:putative heme-binding domain-containing protein